MNQKEKRFIFVILAAALILRIIYFGEIWHKPCFYLEKWNQTDMSFFILGAKDLLEDDWWQNKPFFPYHIFHQRVAPKEKWQDWLGKKYYKAPFYPYLIALTYKFFGPNPILIKSLQSLLGILTVLLIYLIAKNFFSEQSAHLAALISLFYSPFYFYESLLLRASFLTFLYILNIWIFLKIQNSDKIYPYFFFGAILGLTFLLKENIILVFLTIIFWQGWKLRKKGFKTLVQVLGSLTLGLIVVLLPLIYRNLLVLGSMNPFSALGVIIFILGNSVDVNGEAFTFSRYLLPIIEQTKGSLFPSVIKTIETHPDIFSFLKLLGHKAYLFWHWFEFSDNANYYYFQGQSIFLKYFTLTFFLFGPLSLLGIILSLKEIKKYIILYIPVICVFITHTATFALGRFRLPAVPFLIIFAAFALNQILQAFKKGKRTTALSLIFSFLVLALLINPPASFSRPRLRTAEFWFASDFYARQGKFASAEETIKKALILEPNNSELRNFLGWIKANRPGK